MLRCLILCWTGDHPAQCEVGKFLASGGVHACRRDKLQGLLIHYKKKIITMAIGTSPPNTSQYYYGYYARHPWPMRSLDDTITEMRAVDDDDRVSVRQKKTSETGFTGLSILQCLHALYKFDVLRDFVFDAMHTVLLRIVKRHRRLF